MSDPEPYDLEAALASRETKLQVLADLLISELIERLKDRNGRGWAFSASIALSLLRYVRLDLRPHRRSLVAGLKALQDERQALPFPAESEATMATAFTKDP